jgi:hypothetical protein
MADYLDELKVMAREYLPAGEQVIDALNVNYGGKVNLNQPPTGLAALGHPEEQVAAGEALVERMGDHPDVTFPSARQMALVLTEGRLLMWSRGGFKGKPKAFIGEVPLDALEQVGAEEARIGTRLMIKMRSGWEVNLDTTHAEAAMAFTNELQSRVERAAEPGGGPPAG